MHSAVWPWLIVPNLKWQYAEEDKIIIISFARQGAGAKRKKSPEPKLTYREFTLPSVTTEMRASLLHRKILMLKWTTSHYPFQFPLHCPWTLDYLFFQDKFTSPKKTERNFIKLILKKRKFIKLILKKEIVSIHKGRHSNKRGCYLL